MLRASLVSGEALAPVPAEEVGDVRGLKLQLHQLPGVPPRFRQRILFHGSILADDVKIDPSTELGVVLLPFVEASQTQARDLLRAASHGDANRVEAMLQLPLDPDLLVDGRRALAVAALRGNVQVVRLLLEARCDPNLPGNDGSTALMLASCCGHAEVAQLLLEASADVDLTDNKGQTALLWAAGCCRVGVMRMLLNAGADIDLANHNGGTPLMWASFAGNLEAVRLLLKAGANKDLVAEGWTASMWASRAGHVEVARLLLEAGAT